MKLKVYSQCYDGTDGLFYLKSEADKVIAELKDKVLQYKVLYKELCRDINTQERNFALQVNYQKYKRCLPIARTCKRNRLNASVCGPIVKIDFWEKWHRRWLELAEKFKETK